MNTEELIGRQEAKRILKIKSDVTLWNYYRAGRIPFYRLGRRILFNPSELLDAIHVPVVKNEKHQTEAQ